MDFTKCANDTCPLRHSCFRFQADSKSEWQYYSRFEPRTADEEVECDYYINFKQINVK